MKFSCDRCDAQYMISDEKVGPNGVKVRCKKCSHVILVKKVVENGAAAPESPVPAPAPSPGGAGEGLDAELGQAFDNAFGAASPKAPAELASPASPAVGQGPDLDATQAVTAEEAARLAARSAPPEPASTEWYVAIGQAQVGPLPLTEVRRKWEAGDVGPDSLVWRPGMGDWAPLTGVSDLAAYLSPVPQGAATRHKPMPSATPAPTRAASSAPVAAQVQGGDVAWKPVGASALAALASEELSSPSEARAERKPVVSASSLVDGLPDGGGVDPTGAIPLQIRALETTGEAPVQKSSVARGAERLRKKRSSTRALVGLLIALVVVGGGYFAWDFTQRRAIPPPPAPVAAAEKPAPPPAEKPAPAPAAEPEPAPAPAAAAPAAEAPPQAEAKAVPAPPPAPPPAAKEPERPRPERTSRPARTARAEKKAPEPPPPTRQEKVARAEEPPPPAPPPPPAKKKSNDILDFDSNSDAALDEALGGKASGRAVYVPPAPGAAGALPDHVTDSQVNETIVTRVSALQKCLADNKSEESGVLKMRWAIAPDGSVKDLKNVTAEGANTPFAACVTNVIKGLRFPKSVQGRPEVTFPFKF